jgi:hypothetical protein
MSGPPFHLKIRIGEIEVELGGSLEEVIETLDNLDDIVNKVSTAFKLELSSSKFDKKRNRQVNSDEEFPTIQSTNQCSEAVRSLLSTNWGKTPRTIGELREAMEANAIFFPKTTLSGVLVWLVKKGTLRRWKDKKRGYIYVINELPEGK